MPAQGQDTLPIHAIDLKLLKQNLRQATYADIPFGVVTYKVQSGRDVETTTLYKGSPTTIGGGSGASSDRAIAASRAAQQVADIQGEFRAPRVAALQKSITNEPVPLQPGQNLHELESTETYWKKVASSHLITPGEHPLVDDKGALPTKVMLRAFFVDQTYPSAVERDKRGHVTEGRGRRSYTEQRDRFLEKVNNPNPYILQLPTYGAFPAVTGTVHAEYDHNKGGVEYVDVEFFRATTDLTMPSPIGDKSVINELYSILQIETTVVIAVVQANIQSKVSTPTGIPTHISDQMKLSVSDRLATFAQGAGALPSGIIQDINDAVATIDKFNRQIVNISNQINTLILAPARLAQHIQDTYNTLLGAITSPVESYNYMIAKLDTFISDMQDVTYDALDTLGLYDTSCVTTHMGNAFGVMAQASKDTDYTSVEEVITAREEITDRYASIVTILARFPEYADLASTINNMYGMLIEYLITQQANLPNAKDIITRKNTPLIVTAYNVYGDATLEESLAQRNKITSRLFPPVELEVLAL